MIRNISHAMPIIFHIEDFGAKGDGVTNDGVAFAKAMLALSEADDESPKYLILKPDTVYRIIDFGDVKNSDGVPANATIYLSGVKNVSIIGDNTSLSIKVPCGAAVVSHSENIHISGLDIGFNPSPMITGTLTSFTEDGEWFDFEVDQDEDCNLPLGEVVYPDQGIIYFMVPNNPDLRQDFFVDTVQLVEKGHLRCHQNVKLVPNKISWYMHSIKVGDEFIIPRVGFGQTLNGGRIPAFSVDHTNNLEVISCHFHDIPCMVCAFGMNGKILFKDVRLMPSEGSRNKLVSWRDGFHCKDHYEQCVFEDCQVGMLGDDVFNLATNYHRVFEAVSDTKFVLYSCGKGDTEITLNPGDTIGIIDMEEGYSLGRATVVSAVYENGCPGKLTVCVDKPIKNAKKDHIVELIFNSTNPDGFLVKNCDLVGSIRIKAPATFENCRIKTSIVYISNEQYWEGPLPTNIHLRNCEIISTYPGQAWLETPTIPSNEELDSYYPDKNLAVFVNACSEKQLMGTKLKTEDISIENCKITGIVETNGNDVKII